MTIIAPVAGGDMIDRLSGCLNTVVAACAAAGYGGVIHESDGAPACGDMTIRALPCRHDVIGRFR